MQHGPNGYELTWEGSMLQDQSKNVLPHLFGLQSCLKEGLQGSTLKRVHPHYMIMHQNNSSSSNEGPVTVIVTRKAKKGKVKEFEEWLDGIIHEGMKFDGHMGVNVIRPSDQSNP